MNLPHQRLQSTITIYILKAYIKTSIIFNKFVKNEKICTEYLIMKLVNTCIAARK